MQPVINPVLRRITMAESGTANRVTNGTASKLAAIDVRLTPWNSNNCSGSSSSVTPACK